MLTRLIDHLKLQGITAFMTNLTSAEAPREQTELDISSIVDTWIMLRDVEQGGERNRAIYILKSRGMAHSNQIREFRLTDHGIDLVDVYRGSGGVLTGSARKAQESREEAAALHARQALEGMRREMSRKRAALEARVASLRARFEVEEAEARRLIAQEEDRQAVLSRDRERSAEDRGGKSEKPTARPGAKPGGRT